MSRRRRFGSLALALALAWLVLQSPLEAQAIIDNSDTSPNAFSLGLVSSYLADTGQGAAEEGLFAVNGNTATIISPGDDSILRIIDQDGYLIEYKIFNNEIQWFNRGTTATRTIRNDNDGNLHIMTDGGFINFFTDLDGDTGQGDIMRVFNNGAALSNRVLQLDVLGNLEIDGTLTQNFAFDLAEAFLASEPLQAGDLVSVDPLRPDAVLRAQPGDRAVLGVVSGRPGVLLGGGAFSVERLEENWGIEVADRFRAEQASLAADALVARPELRELADRTQTLDAFAAGTAGASAASAIKPEDMARMQDEFAAERLRLEQELEAAAIDLFFERNFVSLALAGRLPVKVDAANGPIAPGDLLAVGSRPGRAAKATHAGPVVGIALEHHASGDGEIMMLVQRGWYGGGPKFGSVAAAGELERLRSANAALERRLSELEAAMTNLAGSTRLVERRADHPPAGAGL